MAGNGQFGRLTKSAGFRIAGTHTSTREPARSGKKKPQPRTVGVLLLVVGGEIFVGGSSGRLSQVRRGGGMCPLPMLDLGTIRLVSSFGGGIIAVRGDPSPTIEKTIYFIDPH